MTRIIADIWLLSSDEGGRRTPLNSETYRATVFFENCIELQGQGYDCRMSPRPGSDSWVSPGASSQVALTFLSADKVVPLISRGMVFAIWEGKKIGTGKVVELEAPQ